MVVMTMELVITPKEGRALLFGTAFLLILLMPDLSAAVRKNIQRFSVNY